MVRNLPANARYLREMGLIPETGRSPGGGHDNPPQYLAQRISMDKGAWWPTVNKVTKSDTTEDI